MIFRGETERTQADTALTTSIFLLQFVVLSTHDPLLLVAKTVMHRYLLCTVFGLLISGLVAQPIPKPAEFHGQYLGQDRPGYRPETFVPVLFSTYNEYGFHPKSSVSFSPDGNELNFTSQTFPVIQGRSETILFMREISGVWAEPREAVFSGEYSDRGAFYSQEGNYIYFVSTRPLRGRGGPKDGDIWRSRKIGDDWSDPSNLGPPINTAFDEMSGAVTEHGTMFFSSNRPGGRGDFDVYLSRLVEGIYSEPQNLGGAVNTIAEEHVLCVAPDMNFLIFSRRANKKSNTGLYIVYRNSDGSWTKAKSMGDHINVLNAAWASLSPDGNYLFFLGEGYGMYWLRSALIEYLKTADLDISEILLKAFSEKGVATACSTFYELNEKHSRYIELGEFLLNEKGYQLLEAGDVRRAISIFTICVALFPDSWNAYDSMGEAYLAAGEIEQAKSNYQKSLQLNPNNANASDQLNSLGNR